ncbi:bifunctional folylpolyglutamate synthase/dihydrofolate synthase [candidate division WOR-3 bacterium]|nr:bifunctional folylpolyglutamate synthase/dihydrofolate synthase [candidate division WOR-3 bacterium]
MTYKTARAFLDSLVNYEKKAVVRNEFKLDNIRRLLELAGNPQKQLNNVVLIAGTKGKGSVAYMVEAGLRGCGLRTGLFVSPHVISVRERIQLAGNMITKRDFARLVERFVPLVKRQRVSYFELLTAMAFDFFARARVDYAVIEVGMGGRLDATNLSEPMVSVITRIGYDHIKVLGGTLRKIAREKAGIMRAGKPVVIGAQFAEARQELEVQARKIGAIPFWVEERSRVWDESVGEGGIGFSCWTELGGGRVNLNLLGRHQIENCRTALTVLGVLAKSDVRIRFEPAVQGLSKVVIPARCQIVRSNPLLIVDSCHNPESGQALANVIREYLKDKVVLIYGSLRGKLVKKTIAPLAPYTDTAIVVAPDSPRAMNPSILKGVFRRLGVLAETAPDLKAALKRAEELSAGRLPIVVAGSFYLAGAVLALLSSTRVQKRNA